MLSNFYQQIQVIMTFLGYYDGKCDGIWGPKCIAAKRKWEYEDAFEPAVPTNGNPFTGRDRLPKGLMYKRKGLEIVCIAMTEEDRKKILDAHELVTNKHLDEHFADPETEIKPTATVAATPAPKVSSHVEPAIDAVAKQQIVSDATPVPTVAVAAGVSSEKEEEEEEESDLENTEEEQKPQNPNQNQNSQNNSKRDWTQQKRK